MDLNIILDKNSNVPIYRQVICQLKEKIENGEIKNGDRLPTERKISQAIGISRGTVKKAYEELTRCGMLEAIQGRGTFVSWNKEAERDEVCQYIRHGIDHMKNQGFSYGEMQALLNVMLEKEHDGCVVNIASIDCNPEALEVFACQISSNYNVKFYPFMLDEVRSFLNGAEIFKNFDLIFSTTTHFEELSCLLENHANKILKAAVSPDMGTIVGLAGINPDMSVGILTKSSRFAHIIHNITKKTTALMREPQYYLLSSTTNNEDLKRFLDETQILIMPPFYTLQLNCRQEALLLNYCANGGRIITFNYVIERGSLIHISDRISNILQQNNMKGMM